MAAILLNSSILAFVLLISEMAVAQVSTAPSDVVSELTAMQQRILATLLAGEREAYAAMLAPEWRVTYTDGTVRTRSEVLGQVFGGPEPTLSGGRVDEVEVRVIRDDLAVVTGRTEAIPRRGAPVRLRFVDVATRRNDRWLITASFASFAP